MSLSLSLSHSDGLPLAVGQGQGDAGAAPGGAVYADGGAHALGSLVHDVHADVPPFAAPGERLRVKTAAVVAHGEDEVVSVVHMHLHVLRLGVLADVTDNSIAKNYINETIFRVSGLIIQEARDDNLKNANADITDTSVEVNTKMVADNVYDRIYEIKKYYYINKSREITEKIKFGDIYKDEALVKELQEEKILLQKEMDNLAVIKKLKGGVGE